jgi:hypothetical protein
MAALTASSNRDRQHIASKMCGPQCAANQLVTATSSCQVVNSAAVEAKLEAALHGKRGWAVLGFQKSDAQHNSVLQK